MRQNAFLPFIRRKKIWAAAMAALLVFIVAGALLSRAVADSRDQLNRAYDEMEIDFRLGPGRTRFGNTFSISLFRLGELAGADWYEDLHASYAFDDPTTTPAGTLSLTLLWAADPQLEYGAPESGQYGSGIYLSPSLAEKAGTGLGESFPTGRWSGHDIHGFWEEYCTVTALCSGIPDDTVVLSWDTFSKYAQSEMTDRNNLVFREMTFRIRPERNRDIRDIVTFVQKTVNNTPDPADRNKFVAVYYNEAEIKGVMDPLEEKQASALFFEKLFSVLLPAAAHVLEAVAALSLANECGVKRLLGEGRGRVFLSLWIPAAALLSLCYLLAAGGLALCGLVTFLHPGTVLLHAGISLSLTALVTALLCLIDPLTLLKEKNDE